MPSRFRATIAVTGMAGLALALAACSSSSSSTSASSTSTSSTSANSNATLTVGVETDTLSLNPAGGCSPTEYCDPAYDTLIHETASGTYEADLATSWQFTNASHTTFQLTLRQGVKFTDGTTLNATDVANSINRFLATPGTTVQEAGPAKDAVAVSEYVVDINYTTAVPYSFAENSIAQKSPFTMIVGPTGLANAKSLDDSSDGIGPYKLDPAETVVGSVYTYVPNSLYFNQSAIKFGKVVLKVMQDPSSRLSAAESSQIDWAQSISLSDVSAAKSSGLSISQSPLGLGTSGVAELLLEDRTSGPLASQDVRQALEYALPRAAIASTVYGKYATATSSVIPEGVEGYNPADTNLYAFDPSKAEKLLAAAGYPNGITINVLDASAMDPGSVLGQALQSALAVSHIKLNLISDNASVGSVIEGLIGKKYQAAIYMGPADDAFSNVTSDFKPGTQGNAFATSEDPTLAALAQKAALASTVSAENAYEEQITTRLDELAWAVPVASVPTEQATSTAISNVPSQYLTLDPDPFSPVASQDWTPSS